MWIRLIQVLVTIIINLAFAARRSDINSKSKLIIGGLFPVHRKGPNETQPCGEILLEKGIQRLEAMLYAIDVVNRNEGKSKFSLGAMVLDTCSSDSYALDQSLQFLQIDCGSTSSKKKVTGIVGASNSAVSESVANIFRLFKIPQVSYASTSEELDNLHKYPYFFRVVPSDKFQIRTILDLLLYFNWSYVSAVAIEGDYGENAIKSLQEQLDNITSTEICLADVHILPRTANPEDYENAVKSLMQHEKVKVVIVFLNEDKVRLLLNAVKNSGAPKNRFLWLGSDGWGAKINPVRGNEEYAEGAITILPKRFPIEGFDEYFLSLKPETNSRNPWFQEFWEHQFGCSFSANESTSVACTGDEDLREVYQQEGLVPMVIDSVWLIASAIKSLCHENPNFCKFGDDKDVRFRKLLKQHIAKANINSSQGHGMVIKFDGERNIPTQYNIYQYQRTSNGKFMYKEIGEWTRGNRTRLKITERIVWDGTDVIPKSRCSDECDRGEERRVNNRNPKKRCCWECRMCDENEFLPDALGHCTPCDPGFTSDTYRTGCIELQEDYNGRDLRSLWALIPFSFAIFGLVCTLAVFVVFLLYHKTPIIMASGRELCYITLLGVALCYCFTFVVISKPTVINCGVLRIGMGLGLSMCYSAIFTKTNRISRIFNRSIRIAKRPSYISPESQIVICSCLILIQIILSVMWLIVSEPKVSNVHLYHRSNILQCAFDGTSVILGLLYNMVLIILCTYYAYKTRNIPENFNESKYISFTMYATCIVWLAFIPIYSSTFQEFKVQATVLCMGVSISGTVTLACMFLPKIYIVVFHPEQNVRCHSSSPYSSTPTISIAPVRFLRSNQSSPATPHRNPFRTGNELDSNDDNLSINQSRTNLHPNG